MAVAVGDIQCYVTQIVGTIITSVGFFCSFYVSFNRSFNSRGSCHSYCLTSINADRICKCCADFNSKAIQYISLGMNLLIYLIGSSAAVIAGIYLQANQVFVESEIDSVSASIPSPESYNLIFLTAALISVSSVAFAILLNKVVEPG